MRGQERRLRLTVTTGDRRIVVDLPEGEGQAPRLDGEPVVGEALRLRPGLYSVLVDGRSYEVTLEALPEGDGEVLVSVDGATLALRVEDGRRHALRSDAADGRTAGAALSATVLAPMPGRVVTVNVAAGATVERGQTVIVLEAMKMESALAAPQAGTVSEVFVSAGQTVQQRQPLVRIQT